MARILWHNWVKQEERGEWEKGNQGWTGATERELWRRRGSPTLESHLLHEKINWIWGISWCREESSSKSEFQRAEWEPNRSSKLLAQSPKTENLGWGLGTKTLAPEVSPLERAGEGGAETAWGTRNPSLSSSVRVAGKGSRKQSIRLAGQKLPGSLERGVLRVEGTIC